MVPKAHLNTMECSFLAATAVTTQVTVFINIAKILTQRHFFEELVSLFGT